MLLKRPEPTDAVTTVGGSKPRKAHLDAVQGMSCVLWFPFLFSLAFLLFPSSLLPSFFPSPVFLLILGAEDLANTPPFTAHSSRTMQSPSSCFTESLAPPSQSHPPPLPTGKYSPALTSVLWVFASCKMYLVIVFT